MQNDNKFNKQFDLKNYKKYEIKGFRDIRAFGNENQSEKIVGVHVIGDSLNNIGIFHGDLLIVKITDKHAEENLCVWETPNGRTAKFGYEKFGEMMLHNKADWSQSWKLGEIKLFGVVIRMERDFLIK